MALILVIASAAASAATAIDREPLSPQKWTQSVELSCSADTVRIVGYGASRPNGTLARIFMNGRPLKGPRVDVLRRDLSNPRAAYRIAARCPQGRRGIGLAIYMGEKRGDIVAYRAGSVFLAGNRVGEYGGLAQSNGDTFWFR